MDNAEHDVLAYMSFPKPDWAKLHSTDEIDKTIPTIFAISSSCGRPRCEAWRVGWKRRRAAHSVPAGLRRPHTRRLLPEDVVARRQRSAHSSFLLVALLLRLPRSQFHGATFVGDEAGPCPAVILFLRQHVPAQRGKLSRHGDGSDLMTAACPDEDEEGAQRSRCFRRPGRLDLLGAGMAASGFADPAMVGRPQTGLAHAALRVPCS